MAKMQISILILILFFCYGCSNTRHEILNKSIALSKIAEDHELSLAWNPTKFMAVIGKEETHIEIQPKNRKAWILGSPKIMDFPAYVYRREIYIPKTFYLETMKKLFKNDPQILNEKDLDKFKKKVYRDIKLSKINIKNFSVFIDAGHGGRDPGAIAIDGTYEKTYALDIAKRIALLLKKIGITVIMARTKDVYLKLDQRVKLANQSKSNCFISIHLNSAGVSQANGFEIWISPDSKQKRYTKSLRLANNILYYLKEKTPLNNRGIRKMNFRVIHKTKIPAVLIECGFLSNRDDLELLSQIKHRHEFAKSVVYGILNYYLSYMKK